jgi:uncharacterized protein YndB with AHSA1/START domain
MKRLSVEQEITIHASPAKVWDVLVKPEFIKQWDDVPENFEDEALTLGSEMLWRHPDGKTTSLTTTELEPLGRLKLALHVSNWQSPPPLGDVAYAFSLSGQNGETRLSVTIGDFAKLPDGQQYYDASVEFAETALPKIKELAEK